MSSKRLPQREFRFSRTAIVGLCCLLFFLTIPAVGQAQIVAADPMVRITSLPLPGVNVNELLVKISDDVASGTGIPKEMLTYYYQSFEAMYCPVSKDPNDRVIFVDLYVPIFMTDLDIGKVMTTMAESISRHTGFAKEWVFIHTHYPKPGHVYISGKIADDKPPQAPNEGK
jgi:hypothetical protein